MGVLDVLSVFDWISPLMQIGEQVGGMQILGVELDSLPRGWTGNDMLRELRRRGVKTGTATIVSGEVLVPVSDRKKAERIIKGVRERG